MTTYVLSTVFQGRRYQHDYWPGTKGSRYQGYVTSFRQFQEEIAESSGYSNLDFYVVSHDGESRSIASNSSLRSAVDYLDDGDVLSITAYSSGNRGGERWDAVESDEEETVEYASEPEDSEDEDEGGNSYDILERFGVSNTGSECYYRCGETSCGYVYRSNSAYSLCDSCYGGLSRSEKRTWVGRLPWDEDVPSSPLYARSDYAVQDEVCHLQYLLTKLGYMSLSATSKLVGSYQGYTQEAVRRFRRHYGIRGGDTTVYDEKTEAKLEEVVRQRRRQGYLQI